MEGEHEQVEQILAKYQQHRWGQSIPQLGEDQVEAFREYAQTNNFRLIAGAVLIDTVTPIWGEGYSDRPNGLPTIFDALKYNQHAIAELDNHVDRFVGPYIYEDGTFVSKGIAVWGLRDAAIKRRSLAS